MPINPSSGSGSPASGSTCVTVDDILDSPVNCESAKICCTNEILQENLSVAQELVQCFTEYDLCPLESCIKVMSTGNEKLFLTVESKQPIVSLTSVTIVKTGVVLDVESKGEWIILTDGGCFPCGELEVCGIFGLSPMPAAIIRAIKILTLELSAPGITGLVKPFGVSRAGWDDFSISYRADEAAETFGRTTGIREVDNILANYINQRGMFQVIQGKTNCPGPNCTPTCGTNCGCGNPSGTKSCGS